MSHPQEHSGADDADLQATQTPGYKMGEKKSMAEYEQLDAEDPAMVKWKASLGVGAAGSVDTSGPNIIVKSLSLHSTSNPSGPITLNFAQPGALEHWKKNPITIKEGEKYHVELAFSIKHTIVTGLRFLQIVKRAGLKVDKLDSMLGSFGPSADVITKKFEDEEAPSGTLVRTGTYTARSRITDDDNHVYADFEWVFKIGKEWKTN